MDPQNMSNYYISIFKLQKMKLEKLMSSIKEAKA